MNCQTRQGLCSALKVEVPRCELNGGTGACPCGIFETATFRASESTFPGGRLTALTLP